MSLGMIGIIGICLLFVLMFLNMPIGLAMALCGLIGFGMIRGFDAGLSAISLQSFRTASTYVFSVIPLFIAMGMIASRVRLSSDLFRTMHNWIGHWRGGLAMATTGACAMFAAICGDPISTASTVGVIALPEMRKYKYKDILSTGCLAAGGNLGFLIPPSLAFIIYGILTEQAIGTLFIAGILPGLLLAVLFMITIWGWCLINPTLGPPSPRATWGNRLKSIRYVAGTVILMLIVLGGIYVGLFTPTEAAAVGVFGVLVIGFVYRRLTWGGFTSAIGETASLTGRIFILIIGAMIFSRFMTVSEIPLNLALTITALNLSPYIVLALVLILYIIIGFVVDIMSIIMITAPILHHMLVGMGFDPVWLAVVIMITILMGQISPPVGLVVYALAGMVKDVPMFTIFKGVFPFLGSMAVCLVILIIFPQIALFLPYLMRPV